jgi:hypothetical protein
LGTTVNPFAMVMFVKEFLRQTRQQAANKR